MATKKQDPFKKDPLVDDPELRKKHEKYLKDHKKRLRQLEYEASLDFLERPPRGGDGNG